MKSERKRWVYDPCREKVVRTIPCYEKKGVAWQGLSESVGTALDTIKSIGE